MTTPIPTRTRRLIQEDLDIPQDVEVKPPSTPDGLDDAFATEFTRKAVEIRGRILGDRPQLREFQAVPRSLLHMS